MDRLYSSDGIRIGPVVAKVGFSLIGKETVGPSISRSYLSSTSKLSSGSRVVITFSNSRIASDSSGVG